MKKVIVVLVLVSLFVLSACTHGARYEFSGSSDNWDVFYTVEVSKEKHESTSGIVKYTGEGEPPDKVAYRLETSSGSSEGTGVSIHEGSGRIANGSCDGCAIVQPDEEIEVEISWDGQTERLILRDD